MSLDVYLSAVVPTDVYTRNITHNLGKMAVQCGAYEALWRPEEINVKFAKDLIPLLTSALEKLKAEPDKYKKFDAPNGWGKYENFVEFVDEYLQACKNFPEAEVRVSR